MALFEATRAKLNEIDSEEDAEFGRVFDFIDVR